MSVENVGDAVKPFALPLAALFFGDNSLASRNGFFDIGGFVLMLFGNVGLLGDVEEAPTWRNGLLDDKPGDGWRSGAQAGFVSSSDRRIVKQG